MPPTPTPAEAQIEKVREITRLRSYSDTEKLVNALNDSQWANTLTDITEWGQKRDGYIGINRGPVGAMLDPNTRKLAITNRVRERLGLGAITNSSVAIAAANGYAAVTITPD